MPYLLRVPNDYLRTFMSLQVYVADIEGHEGTRSTMNECAYYVISKAGGTPYAGAVAEKQKHLNDRWRALCQQLGITYKKAEETRYGLKLLEIQLKQLNTWMAEVESRLMEFTVTASCVLTEIQKKAKEMKVQFVCKLFLKILVHVRFHLSSCPFHPPPPPHLSPPPSPLPLPPPPRGK